jgi:hypothetical protein
MIGKMFNTDFHGSHNRHIIPLINFEIT